MVSQTVVQKNLMKRIEAKVNWYDPEKGYGFLVPDDGSADIFMHFSTLDEAGCQHVEKGDCVVCEIGPGNEGLQVLHVLEIKFGPRDVPSSPGFLDSRLPSFNSDTLEEINGEIKWFNPLKGYGFLVPDDGGEDIFLHNSVLQASGLELLKPGARVSIKVSSSERGREARVLSIMR